MMNPSAITVMAPAKLNLTLSVKAQRPDGYHELSSLITFAELTDRITLTPRDISQDRLTIEGEMADQLKNLNDNTVIKALALYKKAVNAHQNFDVKLIKSIPVAAGLGGGSADGAAALMAINRFYQNRLSSSELKKLGLTIGADVPVCLGGHEQVFWHLQGAGEVLTPVDFKPNPALGLILINPKIALKTKAVFKELSAQDMRPASSPPLKFKEWLLEGNSLTKPACRLVPMIGDYLAQLSRLNQHDGFITSGMSGSGATCFAVFDDVASAKRAREHLCDHLNWVWTGGLYSPSLIN